MANPSTVPASAAGTEILRRVVHTPFTDSEFKLIDGTANYTYTVLSITFCNPSANDETFHMWIDYEASGTDVYLLNQQPLNARECFIWNDKIMLAGTDELVIEAGNTASMGVTCTYIEQRWA